MLPTVLYFQVTGFLSSLTEFSWIYSKLFILGYDNQLHITLPFGINLHQCLFFESKKRSWYIFTKANTQRCDTVGIYSTLTNSCNDLFGKDSGEESD